MIQTIKIKELICECSSPVRKDKITYILYPMDVLTDWIEPASKKYDTTIVVITGMDWQNVFSPGPAKGVPAGSEDFLGESPEFLNELETSVIPQVEKSIGMDENSERTLVGVSMSGLFTLWQWPQSSLFTNIACLSGSFWYEGFMNWFAKQDFADKTGIAFFLLGLQEPKSNVKAFRIVGENTEKIVSDLKEAGVRVEFRWVPGNHYQNGLQRLDLAMTAING